MGKLPYSAAGPAVVPPPGDGEFRRTDHTHRDPRVGDPDRSLRAQLVVHIIDVIERLQNKSTQILIS
jgi:hypothetical protein